MVEADVLFDAELFSQFFEVLSELLRELYIKGRRTVLHPFERDGYPDFPPVEQLPYGFGKLGLYRRERIGELELDVKISVILRARLYRHLPVPGNCRALSKPRHALHRLYSSLSCFE